MKKLLVFEITLLLVLNLVNLIISEFHNVDRIENDSSENLEDKLNPIIIIPGLEGTRLKATLNRKSVHHYYCRKIEKKPFTVWINVDEFVIPFVSCFVDNMKLTYDNKTRKTSNAEGVDVFVSDFGDTDSIETLIANRLSPQFSYLKNMVEMLVEMGYERNKSVRGAPFDFRLAPNEQADFFENLIELIESTYRANGQRKVILICHSMGCLYTLNLLNVRKSQAWKDRYISTLFAFCAPWIGSIKALKTLVTGDNMGIFLFGDNRFKDMERTFPSIAFLLPIPSKFPSHSPSIITPKRNYTFYDYKEIFSRMNKTDIYDMWLDSNDMIGDLKFPNVDMQCIYGTGQSTERQLIYDDDKDYPEKPKKVIFDKNGDSSVNLESLEYCNKWMGQKKYRFKSLKFDDGHHLHLIRESRTLIYLRQQIMEIASRN